MTFRLKTILGIAFIEGVLLAILIVSSINYLLQISDEQLAIRAKTTAELLINLTFESILTKDVATLESIAEQVLKSPELVYLRIIDAQYNLVTMGDETALADQFIEDTQLSLVDDGIFDASAEIVANDIVYGRVEIGIAIGETLELIGAAKRHLSWLALIEMLGVALFSYILGSYLTRGLSRLTYAAEELANGALGHRIAVVGKDELATACIAFNSMSQRLAETSSITNRSVLEGEKLNEKLFIQQQKLTTILNTAVDGFVIIDEQGIIDEVNNAGALLFGYSVEQLTGCKVSCLMAEPFSQDYDGNLDHYKKNKGKKIIGIGREAIGLRKDGSTFPMELAVSEMKLGQKSLYVGLVRDLTEKKKYQYELHKSETLKLAIVEANLDALVTIDINSKIVEFSSQAEQVFGYTRAESIGQSMPELLMSAEMRPMHNKGMAQFTTSQRGPIIGKRVMVTAMRKNGALFPIELTVQPINLGNEMLFTAFIRDITERKAFEDELQHAKQKAEAASEAKSRFLAHMSHEIRSPLNAVLGSVGLLLQDEVDTEKRLYAKTAQSSANSLLSLINDILDFSKIEAGQLQLTNGPFELESLITETADSMTYRTQETGLQTAIVMNTSFGFELLGDALRVRQIMINLVDNALKFTETGAVVVIINTRHEEDERVFVNFTIKDTGIGIPNDEQERLFQEFQQVDNSDSTRFGGTGLGLSICKGLTIAMGGTIELASEVGKGTQFSVTLPFTKGQPLPQADRHTKFEEKCSGIFIGFEPLTTAALVEYYTTRGESVDVVGNVAAALPLISRHTFAILINASLPEDELLTLSAKARSLSVKHLILSRVNLNTETNRLVKTGTFDDLLVMPLVVHKIFERIIEIAQDKILQANLLNPNSEVNCNTELNRDTLSHDSTKIKVPTNSASLGHILLAEDSLANQIVAKGIITRAGYTLDIVENGQQAIDAFLLGCYDIILMDLRMPIMNGLEATSKIRACTGGNDITIIALTANASQEDKARCLAAGMDDFLAKPIDKKLLFEMIQRHILLNAQFKISQKALPNMTNNLTLSNEADQSLVIDPQVLQQLSDDVSAEALPQMLEVFLQEVEIRAQRVADGLTNLTLSIFEDEAHTLKSCAGTFGAIRLQILAKELEMACKTDNRELVLKLARELPELLNITIAAYQQQYPYLA